MSEVDYSAYSRSSVIIEDKRAEQQRTAIKVEQPQSRPVVQPQTAKVATVEPVSQEKQAVHDLETKLESVDIDSSVVHKKFGKGTVVKINKNEKFIHIKFTLSEKKFIFPDAFLMGFLEVE